jgi:hypothetical protein
MRSSSAGLVGTLEVSTGAGAAGTLSTEVGDCQKKIRYSVNGPSNKLTEKAGLGALGMAGGLEVAGGGGGGGDEVASSGHAPAGALLLITVFP